MAREFRRYLNCGILACGLARARCGHCGHDFLIAFSFKGRGVCPSCNARRMVATAAHLADHVAPPRIAPARGPPLREAADAEAAISRCVNRRAYYAPAPGLGLRLRRKAKWPGGRLRRTSKDVRTEPREHLFSVHRLIDPDPARYKVTVNEKWFEIPIRNGAREARKREEEGR